MWTLHSTRFGMHSVGKGGTLTDNALASQTGLCVYEVDDPNQRYVAFVSEDHVVSPSSRQEVSDEQIRLQKRVAELESVIREVGNESILWSCLNQHARVAQE